MNTLSMSAAMFHSPHQKIHIQSTTTTVTVPCSHGSDLCSCLHGNNVHSKSIPPILNQIVNGSIDGNLDNHAGYHSNQGYPSYTPGHQSSWPVTTDNRNDSNVATFQSNQNYQSNSYHNLSNQSSWNNMLSNSSGNRSRANSIESPMLCNNYQHMYNPESPGSVSYSNPGSRSVLSSPYSPVQSNGGGLYHRSFSWGSLLEDETPDSPGRMDLIPGPSCSTPVKDSAGANGGLMPVDVFSERWGSHLW